MEPPSIVHPKNIAINGFKFQVVSSDKLSDTQAFSAAMHFYNTHKFLNNRKKKIIRVVTTIDENSQGVLGVRV